MNNDNRYQRVEEQRRRKAEGFRLQIQDNYDDDSVGIDDYEPEEISSYSGEDVKNQIARESRRSLKRKRRAENKELKERNKPNRRIFRLIWWASVAIIASMLSVFIVTGVNDLLAINRQDPSTVTVRLPENPDLDIVTDSLYLNGVINEPGYFKMYAMATKSNYFAQGDYELHKNMDYQAIISNLEGNASRTDIVEVTIIEGQNVLEVADTLVEGKALGDKDAFLNLCSSNEFDDDFDFLKAIPNSTDRYYKLEGYLYPDKYQFYVNEDPKSIIYTLLNNYEHRIYEKRAFDGYEKLYSIVKMMKEKNTKYSLDEIMNIAAIIQAEAANTADMYNVSSIIHNRLEADVNEGVGTLGLDSTKYYPYRSRLQVPSGQVQGYKSRYDTYDSIGLPPGPICNPGMEAIKAAIDPNETDYYYFCHDKSGKAYYAATIEEHEANLESIQ